MDSLPRIDIMSTSVHLFQLIGESKHYTSRSLLCFRIFNSAVNVLVLTFIGANIFFVKGEFYVQTLQSLLFLLQPLLKYLLFMNYKVHIEKLLKQIATQFWNYQHFDRHIVQAINNIYRVTSYTQISILIVTVFATYSYLLKSLFVNNAVFIVESFIPNSTILDTIILASQFYCFCVGTPIVLAYDFYYFALCIHVVLQIRLLKLKLNDAVSKHNQHSSVEIKKCIQHHQFLFSMFLEMKDIYSGMLLFHYFVTLLTTCSMLVELLLRHAALAKSVVVLTILILITQFALYAFPAEQVAFEFVGIADAIYSSRWYRTSISNQRLLLYIMAVAQRVHYFSAVHLVDINLKAFVTVFKASFSFCLVLRNLIRN